MKPTEEIERGVLPTFRLFTGLQFAINALSAFAFRLAHFEPRSESVSLTPIHLLAPGLLFVYLSIPSLQRLLKSWYLPIAIFWSSVWLILDPYITGNQPPEINANWLWRQIFMLCIPLVVVSWQYSLREVIWFSALTTGLTIALLALTLGFEELLLSPLMVVISIQLIVFLLVGYITVRLLAVQREQWRRLAEANARFADANAQLADANIRLAEANTRLAQQATVLEQLTISRERNRLARELHDILAHTLSGVAVELEGLRSMMSRDPERAQAILSNSLQAIREGLVETRRTLQELRAKPLEDLGLALAVRNLGESYAGRMGFQIQFDIDQDLGDYPIDVQQVVYRVTQEALANVSEHAEAQNVQVALKQDHGQLQLVIRDDGCGFDPSLPVGEYQFGLLGMRERVEMIGGSLAVESQAGQGTQISFAYGGANGGAAG